jgi:hypothetical protein
MNLRRKYLTRCILNNINSKREVEVKWTCCSKLQQQNMNRPIMEASDYYQPNGILFALK